MSCDNFDFQVFLRDEKGLPIVGEEVELDIDGVEDIQHIITGSDGSAKYEIDTSNFLEPNFTIRVCFKYQILVKTLHFV